MTKSNCPINSEASRLRSVVPAKDLKSENKLQQKMNKIVYYEGIILKQKD